MFQMTDPFNMAEFGLVTDKPSNSTALTAWNNSLNVRPKDGSVQGVYNFTDSFSINTALANVSSNSKPVAVTQWTPAGSNFLNVAYILEDDTGKGRVFVHNTDTNVTAELTNNSVNASFTIDDTYPPQIFVFNGLLIVNPATGTPQYAAADATTSGTLQDLPSWLTYGSAPSYPAVARIIRPFGNRLVAMSFVDDRNTSSSSDDIFQPIDFAWSNHITGIHSLSGADWRASTTNTAGDAFLTSTPGKILDGEQLGDIFVAYKSDSVVRVSEIGEPFILGFESVFEDDGVYSTRCVANIGNTQHLVVGNYGVYLHNGQTEKVDLAKGVFQDALFALVNPSHRDRSFLFRQTRDKEVWFCFSSKNNTGEGCDSAFVFDYDNRKVHKRSLPNVSDIYESEVNGSLRIFAASKDSSSLLELSTSTYESDGFFTITDKDFEAPLNTKDISQLIINSEENVKIALDGTYFLKDAKTYSDEYLFDSSEDFKVDVRANGKYFSLKVTMDGDTNPKLTTIAFNVRIAGTR